MSMCTYFHELKVSENTNVRVNIVIQIGYFPLSISVSREHLIIFYIEYCILLNAPICLALCSFEQFFCVWMAELPLNVSV